MPRICLVGLPLALACPRAGDAPGEQVEVGTSSTTGPAEPPTSMPTTAEAMTAGSATASATTATSTVGSATSADDTSTSTSDTSTSADASSTGEARPSSCGNAQLDPGEECDLGLVENSNSGACSIECKDAKCGDGLIEIGKESCDNAGSNNNTLYGGCMQNCQFGPRCNDGKIQGDEECDLGDANGSGEHSPDGVPCDAGCRYQARLVFLSSVAYKGGEIGGVEGADTKCKLLAEKAGYDNSENFMAWLSDALHSPAKDFLHTAGLPFVRPDGVRIADDWDDLVKQGPHDGIFVTENGELLVDARVWTGTSQSGNLLDPAAHCKAWTTLDPSEKSRVGRSGVDKVKLPVVWQQWHDNYHWTNYSNLFCDEEASVYCFEQLSEKKP